MPLLPSYPVGVGSQGRSRTALQAARWEMRGGCPRILAPLKVAPLAAKVRWDSECPPKGSEAKDAKGRPRSTLHPSAAPEVRRARPPAVPGGSVAKQSSGLAGGRAKGGFAR